MMLPTRRVFLKNGGLALVALGFAPSFLARTVSAAGDTRRRILIAIFQRGAVDGLNMVVPHGEQSYYKARPNIAIPRPGSGTTAAIDLDGFFGLHPRLEPLASLYKSGRLAIVQSCGSPDTTRSHFDGQDYLETATPGIKRTPDGWLNRYLQAESREDTATLRAVAIGAQLPRSLQGKAPALAINEIGGFGIRAGFASAQLQSSWEREYAAAADTLLNRAGREAFDAVRTLKAVDAATPSPANGAVYPRSNYGRALMQIAQLVKSNVGLEVAFVESPGWDDHINQGGATGKMATRLDDLARGIAALCTDLGDRMEDVVILTMSEFGREVNQNGNGGTDHGHGNAMLVLGGSVRGGKVYGRWPGLEPEQRFENRDLAVTTDFRDVFGEIIVRHLGLEDPGPIFPGYPVSSKAFLGLLAD